MRTKQGTKSKKQLTLDDLSLSYFGVLLWLFNIFREHYLFPNFFIYCFMCLGNCKFAIKENECFEKWERNKK